jgi:hypothetical protein
MCRVTAAIERSGRVAEAGLTLWVSSVARTRRSRPLGTGSVDTTVVVFRPQYTNGAERLRWGGTRSRS